MRLNTEPERRADRGHRQGAAGPRAAAEPMRRTRSIVKGTGQTFALMYLTFASSEMNPEQVTEFLTRVVQPRFATLEGVGSADILGGRDFSMRDLDRSRSPCLAQRDGGEVVARSAPATSCRRRARPRTSTSPTALEMQTTLQTPEAFGALPIRANGDDIVRLRDVAPSRTGPEEHRHDRQLQRQGRHLHRRHADAVGQPAHRRRSGDEGDRRYPADACRRA